MTGKSKLAFFIGIFTSLLAKGVATTLPDLEQPFSKLPPESNSSNDEVQPPMPSDPLPPKKAVGKKAVTAHLGARESNRVTRVNFSGFYGLFAQGVELAVYLPAWDGMLAFDAFIDQNPFATEVLPKRVSLLRLKKNIFLHSYFGLGMGAAAGCKADEQTACLNDGKELATTPFADLSFGQEWLFWKHGLFAIEWVGAPLAIGRHSARQDKIVPRPRFFVTSLGLTF